MINKPKIRFVEKEDLEELVALCELHAQFEKSGFNRDNKVINLSHHLFSDNPALYCLVVEWQSKLIGYATYMKQFSTWEAEYYVYMDCLFLKEEARGFGIGEQLIERIKEETSEMGCSLIQWQTPDFNTRAMKFYDRIGANSKTKERYFLAVK